jgi:hypothetical protein
MLVNKAWAADPYEDKVYLVLSWRPLKMRASSVAFGDGTLCRTNDARRIEWNFLQVT